MPAREKRRGADSIRITTAPPSRADDTAVRQRHYLISMAIRTACFVGAIVVPSGWVRWVLITGAIVLPYVAVVIANAAASRGDYVALPGAPEDLRQLPETGAR